MRIGGRLSIRVKIISAVVLAVALEVAVASTAVAYLGRVGAQVQQVVDSDTEKLKVAGRLDRTLVELGLSEKRLLLAQTPAQVTQGVDQIQATRAELQARLAHLTSLADPQELATLGRFRAEYQDYTKVLDQIVAQMQAGNVQGAMNTARSRARTEIDQARRVLGGLVDLEDANLAAARKASSNSVHFAVLATIVLGLASAALGLGVGLTVSRSISRGLNRLVDVADAIAGGRLDTPLESGGDDEVGHLAAAVDVMQSSLRRARDSAEAEDWLKTGLTRLNDAMRSEVHQAQLAEKLLAELASYLDAKAGAFYVAVAEDGTEVLSLMSSYAIERREDVPDRFALGEGLVGQAARDQRQLLLTEIPEGYLRVSSGLVDTTPRFVSITPLVYDGRLRGVVELGMLSELTQTQLRYLDRATPAMAQTLETVKGREDLAVALHRSQELTQQLQTQQEELRVANEELEEQTQALKASQIKLRAQQEELEVSNEELEEKNNLLQRQTRETEEARRALSLQADELAMASRYKSEFLANMSHELRTPLNSLLLLARGFADNKDGNLTQTQIEAARVIYGSGNDLLALINDILDLAKIESGRMELHAAPVRVEELGRTMRRAFQHLARDKGLELRVEVAPDAPEQLVTDRRRLEQILKNLLSNAVKFTERGSVSLLFRRATEGDPLPAGLEPAGALAIVVEDTGIGISPEEQGKVFEAFHQVDRGTARKYGGTGLGLSISRELVQLLGGRIALSSARGEGSRFTVLLPLEPTRAQPPRGGPEPAAPPREEVPAAEAPSRAAPPADDRRELEPGGRSILVVEDDPHFAELLRDECRRKDFKCIIAGTGDEGLALARRFLPTAVILDLRLPDRHGLGVLDALKDDPQTRHIPVHIMSVEEPSTTALRKGAVGQLQKPVDRAGIDKAFSRIEQAATRHVKNVLVVEDDVNARRAVTDLLADESVRVEGTARASEALEMLRSRTYDCVILDLSLPDMDGRELLAKLRADETLEVPPIIVYTGRELTPEEDMELRDYSESIIIKDVHSEERLLDEVSLFLHRVVAQMPEKKRQLIADLHDSEALLRNKKVLVVDDDMRTLFALSRLLSERGMQVRKAENGEKALQLLEQEPDVAMVLMDVMMPVLDGYETMRRIRAQERFRRLPIIALTAKAMKGDEEKCLAAGASDYLAKPIDQDRLLSTMRVWLYR